VFANRAALALFGGEAQDDQLDQKLSMLCFSETPEPLVAAENGDPKISQILQLRRVDGKLFSGGNRPARLEFDGRVFRVLVIRDVTEQTRFEQSLQESEVLFW